MVSNKIKIKNKARLYAFLINAKNELLTISKIKKFQNI